MLVLKLKTINFCFATIKEEIKWFELFINKILKTNRTPVISFYEQLLQLLIDYGIH